jgi:crotonobetainyl-CoA:carnitine CoA-transferase CaiB-like acyl-CoA transferase
MSSTDRQSAGPLEGVKVLELGSLIAGPYASALFAQFGAEVIKIEPPVAGTRSVSGANCMTEPHCGGIRKAATRNR